jgi:hypothetical protein
MTQEELDEELVEQLRDLGDHGSYEPHMHHVAATRIVELLAERDWYRDRVVWGFYEDREPKYYQGKAGESEICDPVTAEEVTRLLRGWNDAETRLANAISALQWCGGSFDFADGGIAREGWMKLCAPIIRSELKGDADV